MRNPKILQNKDQKFLSVCNFMMKKDLRFDSFIYLEAKRDWLFHFIENDENTFWDSKFLTKDTQFFTLMR
jgi:hypothetical protein